MLKQRLLNKHHILHHEIQETLTQWHKIKNKKTFILCLKPSASSSAMASSGPRPLVTDMAHPWRWSSTMVKPSSKCLGSITITCSRWCLQQTGAAHCTQATPQASPSTCIPPAPRLSCASSAAGSTEPSPPSQHTGPSSNHLSNHLTAPRPESSCALCLFLIWHKIEPSPAQLKCILLKISCLSKCLSLFDFHAQYVWVKDYRREGFQKHVYCVVV